MTPLLKDKQATVDWSSQAIQQVWFERFKSADLDGLEFQQFQLFLQESLYNFLDFYPTNNKTNDKDDNETNLQTKNNNNNNESGHFTHQQEIELFEKFDLNGDHILDWHEFSRVCQRWLKKIYNPSSALVVVDVQNDFIDGSLALINGPAGQDGAEVVPVINDLIDECGFESVVYTQDWHPIDHIGFHANLHMRKFKLKHQQPSHQDNDKSELNSSNCKFKLKKLVAKAKVYDTVLFEDGQVEQKLWPTHCVQNSWGAQLHPKLRIIPDAIRIYKGTLSHVDAYSAFWDNMRLNETGLRQELVTRDISDLFFCGLAFDYCVSASALDAVKAGFVTFVIEDACRGIDEQEIKLRRDELTSSGVIILRADAVKGYLAHGDKQVQPGSTPNKNVDRDTMMNICFRKAVTMA